MPEGFVYIRMSGDDKTVQPGYVSQEAYDMIWKNKGYEIVAEEEAALAMSEPTRAEMASAEPVKRSSAKKGE